MRRKESTDEGSSRYLPTVRVWGRDLNLVHGSVSPLFLMKVELSGFWWTSLLQLLERPVDRKNSISHSADEEGVWWSARTTLASGPFVSTIAVCHSGGDVSALAS